MSLMMDEAPAECAKKLGTKPWWMSPGQYDQCTCSQPKGHQGKCYCGRHEDDAETPRRKYLEARGML